MLRKKSDMLERPLVNCHDGAGELIGRIVVKDGDSDLTLRFVHDDTIPAGVSIGEHPHDENEEVYYVIEGEGTLIYDGKEYPVGAGDVSVVKRGHTHGIVNSSPEPMRLLVICIGP